MPEQILADVRLHPDAEGMTQISNGKVQERAQHIEGHHSDHHREESPVHLVGQHIV